MGSNRELFLQAIRKAQTALARFARESYQRDGRGMIRVSLPLAPSSDSPIGAVTTMVYHTAADVRESSADITGQAREDAEILVRMVEAYDPDKEAVIVVALADGNFPVKMEVDPPFMIEESRRGEIEKGWTE